MWSLPHTHPEKDSEGKERIPPLPLPPASRSAEVVRTCENGEPAQADPSQQGTDGGGRRCLASHLALATSAADRWGRLSARGRRWGVESF